MQLSFISIGEGEGEMGNKEEIKKKRERRMGGGMVMACTDSVHTWFIKDKLIHFK